MILLTFDWLAIRSLSSKVSSCLFAMYQFGTIKVVLFSLSASSVSKNVIYLTLLFRIIKMGKTALIIGANGSEEMEIVITTDVLRRAEVCFK